MSKPPPRPWEIMRYYSGWRFGASIMRGWVGMNSKTREIIAHFKTKRDAEKWLKTLAKAEAE